jgi:hypothetical protein
VIGSSWVSGLPRSLKTHISGIMEMSEYNAQVQHHVVFSSVKKLSSSPDVVESFVRRMIASGIRVHFVRENIQLDENTPLDSQHYTKLFDACKDARMDMIIQETNANIERSKRRREHPVYYFGGRQKTPAGATKSPRPQQFISWCE